MAYSVAKLITKAYILSGVASKGLQTVSGSQLNEGLELLNALLSIKAANPRKIPFYSGVVTIPMIVGEQKYFYPNLVQVTTVTFNLNDVRLPLEYVTRDRFFGDGRVDNLQTLPAIYHTERIENGTDIYLYPLPNSTYPLNVMGKYFPENVAIEDDLEDTFEQGYIEYLRYLLAPYICNEYNLSVPPRVLQQLSIYEKNYTDESAIDFSLQKRSTLSNNRQGFNWAYANLYNGWDP